MLKICRKNCKGFTLLELLVVVLIIGILAAIALPQYKLAVGKSKFSTLKDLTKSIAQSTQRYYMIHESFPKSPVDLDIDINVISFQLNDDYLALNFNGGNCYIFASSVGCKNIIFNTDIRFYVNTFSAYPTTCLTYSVNTADISNKICQQDTGSKSPEVCNEYWCRYRY